MAAGGTDIQKLLIQVDASVELLRRNLTTGEQQVAQFERQVRISTTKATGHFRLMETASSGIAKGFHAARAAALTFVAGLGVQQIAAAAMRGLEFASSLGEVAQQLGVTTKDLQVYRYAASQAGIEQDEMDKSLAKLTRTIGEAATGSEKQQKLFKALGISIRDANGNIKTAGDIMPQIADALKGIESPAQRAAVMVDLFGKSGQKLDTLLAGGSSQINELSDAAQRLGLVLSDRQIQAADETADKLSAMKQVLEARIAGVVADNASSILALADALGTLVTSIGGAINAWQRYKIESAIALEQNALDGWFTSNERKAEARRRIANGQAMLARLDPQGNISDRGMRTLQQWKGGGASSAPKGVPPGSVDIDDLNGGPGGSNKRSDRDAYFAFKRELEREGIKVGSGFRSTEEQARLYRSLPKGQAARPGTSDHEFYRAFDLPANADPAKIAAAAARAEVTLGKPLVHKGTGLHRHQPFRDGRSEGGGEEDIQRELEEAERARKDAAERAARIVSELAQSDLEILRLKQDAAPDYVEQSTLSLKIVEAERAIFNAALDHRVAMGEISQAHANELKAKEDIKDAERRRAILTQEQVRRMEEVEALAQRDHDAKIVMLGLQADLATTAAERREIELRILELAREEERRRAQLVLDSPTATVAEKEAARRDINDINARLPGERQAVMNRTMGPLEQLRQQIPDTAAEMNEELERVAAGGLSSLTDGLTDAIMGAKSLGDVFKNVAKQIIADLIRIAIQQTIVNSLMRLLPGGGGAAGGVPAIPGGGMGGGSGGFALPEGFRILGGRASGGPVSAGQAYQVGELGRELFIPSVNGNIISNATLRQGRGGGAMGGGMQTVRVLIESDDDMFRGRVREVSGEVVAQAAPHIVDAAARNTIRATSRQRLA